MRLKSPRVKCVYMRCETYLKDKAFVYMCRSYLSTTTGAPSAACCVATDSSCKPSLQQLLSPGVQAVQLVHGAWHEGINRVTLRHNLIAITSKQWWQILTLC